MNTLSFVAGDEGRSAAARRLRLLLLAGASAGVIGMAWSPALAQDAKADSTEAAAKTDPKAPAKPKSADEEAPTLTDEIVVTGLRNSVTLSRDTKENANVLVDSISAQDIGSLPDRSVAEALQRIPGIQIQRTNENRDPARLAAEGGAVFIRGLPWTLSQLNARDVFAANNGRSIGFGDISSDAVSAVNVYKNPSADMIEGSIAGIIDLRTRKPFEAKGQVIAASADFNYADMSEQGFWSGNALYSNRWSLGEGEIGLLLSASVNNIGNRTDSIQTGVYQPHKLTAPQDGLAAGDTVYIPTGLGWRTIDWDQNRQTYNGVLQLAPISDLVFTFEGTYVKSTTNDLEYAGLIEGGNQVWPDYTFDAQHVVQTGSFPHGDLSYDTRSGNTKQTTQDYSINIAWQASDHWGFSVDAQRVYSTAKVLSMTAFSQFGVAPFDNSKRPAVAFDISGNTPNIETLEQGALLSDPANYWWAAAMDHMEDNEAGAWAERADATYTFDDGNFLQNVRFGVRATQLDLTTRQTGWNWGLLSQQFWGSGGGAPVYLNQDPGNNGLPTQTEQINYDNFFRGKVNVPAIGWFPSAALVQNGTANAYSYLKSTETSGWGWTPLTEADFANSGFRSDNVTAGIVNQEQQTLAGYAVVQFAMPDGPLGHFDGNLGIRVVETRNQATGMEKIEPVQNTMSLQACQAAHGVAACQDLANALAFSANGGTRSYTAKNDYTNVLPSLNLRFFLQDRLFLRAAAARAMYRPRFDQMVPFNTYSFTFESDGYTLRSAQVSGGNPYLKPTMANQFDLSLEYYYGPSNKLTFAGFYKHITDYVYAGGETVTRTNNGTTVDFLNVGNSNGSSGSIWGFEVAYTQFFDMLPGALSGLGIDTNFTYLNSSGGQNTAVNTLDPAQVNNAADQTLPLEGISKYTFNIALMYEKYNFSARLAYNWRSEYLLTTSAANLNAPTWFEDYGQLDGSILYSVNSHIKIGIQSTNLLNSRVYLDVGGAQLHPRYSWTDTDRRIAFLVHTVF